MEPSYISVEAVSHLIATCCSNTTTIERELMLRPTDYEAVECRSFLVYYELPQQSPIKHKTTINNNNNNNHDVKNAPPFFPSSLLSLFFLVVVCLFIVSYVLLLLLRRGGCLYDFSLIMPALIFRHVC